MTDKRNNFNLLRLLAAVQVLVGHVGGHLEVDVPYLDSVLAPFPGVPIFFVISGFLISRAYERSPRLAVYARNRFLRVFPALWCCILMTIPAALAFGVAFERRSAGVWFVTQLAGIIYTPQFLHPFGFGSYNGSLWTIPIELQFYLAVPLLYGLLSSSKKPERVVWYCWLTALLMAVGLGWNNSTTMAGEERLIQKLIRYSLLPHAYLFLTGVLLQRQQAERSAYLRGKAPLWLAGYGCLFFFVAKIAPLQPLLAVPLNVAAMVGLALVTLSAAVTAPSISDRLLGDTDISYGVYIYHGLILNIFVELGFVHDFSYATAAIAGALVAGYLSWRFVEAPLLRRKLTVAVPTLTDDRR